jgi:hypothetical protein
MIHVIAKVPGRTFMSANMSEFKTPYDYWKFEQKILRSTRYIYDQEVEDFLSAVRGTAVNRVTTIDTKQNLFRAQKGGKTRHDTLDDIGIVDTPIPYPKRRMYPKNERAKENRANSKGIPYLYLNTDQTTAVAEVRPWIGSVVSVAAITVTKVQRLVDCISDPTGTTISLRDAEPTYPPGYCLKKVWESIDNAFSKPIEPDDCTADYAPTQILAEVFLREGYDGILYRSSLGEGKNVALFEPSSAIVRSLGIVTVESMQIETSDPDEVRHFGPECAT